MSVLVQSMSPKSEPLHKIRTIQIEILWYAINAIQKLVKNSGGSQGKFAEDLKVFAN
jgi:hypothetical protein